MEEEEFLRKQGVERCNREEEVLETTVAADVVNDGVDVEVVLSALGDDELMRRLVAKLIILII
jgi:hypothetical protein